MTSTPYLRPRGFAPLDHLGEELTHPPASHYSKGDFPNVGILQGRGTLPPRIHFYAVLDAAIQSTPEHKFRVSSYAPTRSSILPVFKRLAACFDPSRQSLAPPVHVLYRHPLTHYVLLSSILSLLDAILRSK